PQRGPDRIGRGWARGGGEFVGDRGDVLVGELAGQERKQRNVVDRRHALRIPGAKPVQDRPQYRWQGHVLRSPRVLAWSVPGLVDGPDAPADRSQHDGEAEHADGEPEPAAANDLLAGGLAAAARQGK